MATFPALGALQTPEGTETGNNLFPEWSVVGTGNGNREHVGHSSVLSPARPPELTFDFAKIFFEML